MPSGSTPVTVYSQRLKRLLQNIQAGEVSVAQGLHALRELPFSDLAYAKLDHHRLLRRGFPEVVYGKGKTVGQIVSIAERFIQKGQPVVITRASAAVAARLKRKDRSMRYDAGSGVVVLNFPAQRMRGSVALVTAGTSDMPVAAEAKIILELMGRRVVEIYDVGVAGLHRLMHHL
ncbi:MAG: 1-(5-phosphoribosyl)-5-amino-4-imidazole-carboxylate carboxylase, partial [Candidatus Omnitrophica bacterium]|nr:1-(5-phosphoribosyl)-5-amino-4-imidazole-carboxylate carboxylase [Candidatus Omnitrophota bacterium]